MNKDENERDHDHDLDNDHDLDGDHVHGRDESDYVNEDGERNFKRRKKIEKKMMQFLASSEFLEEYKGALDKADKAVVFYSPHAVKIKQLEEVTKEQIGEAFKRDDLIIYTNSEDFKKFLFSQDIKNKAIILMSSGNYGGLDFEEVKNLI